MSQVRRLLLGAKSNPLLLGKRFAAHERRHERLPVQGILHGCIVHPDGRTTDVMLGDISKGGLSYFVSSETETLRTDEKVFLKIALNDSDREFECVFTIRDLRIDDSGLYRHGLQVMPDAKNVKILAELVEYVGSCPGSGLRDAA